MEIFLTICIWLLQCGEILIYRNFFPESRFKPSVDTNETRDDEDYLKKTVKKI